MAVEEEEAVVRSAEEARKGFEDKGQLGNSIDRKCRKCTGKTRHTLLRTLLRFYFGFFFCFWLSCFF